MPTDEKPAGRDENLCTNQKAPQATAVNARQTPPKGPQRTLGRDNRSAWKASPARNAHPARQSLPARMGKPLASASPKRQRSGQCCEQPASLRAVRPFRLTLELRARGRAESAPLRGQYAKYTPAASSAPSRSPQPPTEADPSPSRFQTLEKSRGESAQTRSLTSGPNGSRRRWSNRPRPQPRTSAPRRQSRHAPAVRHRKPESLPAALPPARAKQDPWMRKRRSCVLSPGEAPPKDSQ